MYKILPFLFFFSFVSESLQAQLISWRDVIEGDLPQPTERIYFGEDSLQFGDLWLPQDNSPHTTVIMIHGGCWLGLYPGVELMHHIADDLSKNGFAVWNLEYRRIGHEGGGYPGTFQDIAAGADYISNLAESYDLNLDRVIASGHSTGGHLATWLAARKNVEPTSSLYSENPIPIHGVISLAGINDLERYASYGSSPCGDQTVGKLVDIENRSETAYLDTSPKELLPLQIPHIEIVAAFDSPVPPFFGRQFVESAKQAGDQAELILLPKAGHYEMIAPWSEEWNEVFLQFQTILDEPSKP